MITELGKFLRKLRIDNGEILKDMSEKLGVTVSFLSAVENGKKKMPSAWNKIICNLYSLNAEQSAFFSNAIANSEETIDIKLNEIPTQNRGLVVSFARKFSDFDERQIEKFKELLSGGKKS